MASPPQTPIQIHIEPPVQKYTISLTQYLAAHPQYTNLVVSAFIFDNPDIKAPDTGRPLHLLILQRAAHERSFANLWEIPGGSTDTNDPTVLHSVAREVFEETGLRLTKLVRQIGGVVEFQMGKGVRQKNWAKLNFEIEVAEIDGRERKFVSEAGFEDQNKEAAGQSEEQGLVDGSRTVSKDVVVKIDPEEHQSYAWATAEDVRHGRYKIATPQQRELILEAFLARENQGRLLGAAVRT